MKNLLDRYEGLLVADGLNDAIIGVSSDEKVVYSINRVLDILMLDMQEDEALDYFYFNIEGAYMGEKTPIYVWTE